MASGQDSRRIYREDMKSRFGHSIRRYVYEMVPNRSQLTARSRTYIAGGECEADFTDGQYEDEYSCWPPPVAMIIISIIEIIAYVYDIINPPKEQSSNNPNDYIYGPAAKLFMYNPCKRDEAWRYLTYMFVHRGVFHLSMNLTGQIMLGIPLEMVHKWWRVLIIYFAGVAAGSLGAPILNPDNSLVGASGGVYALITAHVATIIMNWHQMKYAVVQLCIFIVIATVDVGQAVYKRYVLGTQDLTAYVAHLAAAIAGLLVGINILRNLEVQKWEKVVWWTSISTYIVLMTAAILWNIFGMKSILYGEGVCI